MTLSNGQLSTKVIGDAAFVAKLTPGTVLQFTLSGKLGGTINGMPISGSGHLEYTYRYGATAWEMAADGLAQGPVIPAGDLVYAPANAAGTAAVSTTGVVVSAAPYTSLKDRYNYKLKGRTASIKVSVLTETVGCGDFSPACNNGDPLGYADTAAISIGIVGKHIAGYLEAGRTKVQCQ